MRSKQSIADGLSSRHNRERRTVEVLLDGETIGSIVSYGDRNAMADRRRSTFPKTVYRADALFDGHRLSFEGQSVRSVLAKLADGIHKAQRPRSAMQEIPGIRKP
jgi:hypothetical protein